VIQAFVQLLHELDIPLHKEVSWQPISPISNCSFYFISFHPFATKNLHRSTFGPDLVPADFLLFPKMK
jgi:hypothetical protein